MKKGTILTIWLILALAIGGGLSSLNIPTYVQLAKHSTSTTGNVTEITANNHNTVRYQFTVDNTLFSGQTQPEVLADSLHVGDKITVFYDPKRPAVSVLRNPRWLLQNEITSIAKGRPILVYCWRGGLRSGSMATLLEMTGNPVVQLQGGYKTFRNHVIKYFDNFSSSEPIIVVHGMTGTGKTRFIKNLDPDAWTVIDLEGLACHRGSAFGEIGLVQEISQKHLDTRP